MTTFSPEVVAGARAMSIVLKDYSIDDVEGNGNFGIYHVHNLDAPVLEFHTLAEAQRWIECQAFAAGLAALLPVSEDVEEACDDAFHAQRKYCVENFKRPDGSVPMPSGRFTRAIITAAINHLIGRN